MRRLRLPSPAMIVACIALAVALGGTGYAAIKLPKNSVGARQIRTAAVRSSEVKNGSLERKDFKSGVLLRGLTGAAGPTGPRGPAGQRGAQGAPGPATEATIGNGAIGPDQLASVPAVRLTAGDQSLNSMVASVLDVTEDEDPDGLHDPVDGSQITVKRGGLYLLTATVAWAANGTGFRSLDIRDATSATGVASAQVPALSADPTVISASGVARAAAGDVLRFAVMQKSGAPLHVTDAAFTATYLGR